MNFLSIRDRLEALRRAPRYRQDFLRWQRLADDLKQAHKAKKSCKALQQKLLGCEATIKKKWKVQLPFPPPSDLMTTNKFLGLNGDNPAVPFRGWNPFIEQPLQVLRPADFRQSVIEQTFEGYDPIRIIYDYESARKGKVKMTSTEGKHLCLIIDATARKEDLTKEFESCIKHYSAILPKRKNRNKPTTEIKNIWDVYDQMQSGKTVAEVSRSLTDVKFEDTTVTYPIHAASSATRRAFKKAKALIERVEQAASR